MCKQWNLDFLSKQEDQSSTRKVIYCSKLIQRIIRLIHHYVLFQINNYAGNKNATFDVFGKPL